jgi:hypothetical protein
MTNRSFLHLRKLHDALNEKLAKLSVISYVIMISYKFCHIEAFVNHMMQLKIDHGAKPADKF